jgi:hypothetical protein
MLDILADWVALAVALAFIVGVLAVSRWFR